MTNTYSEIDFLGVNHDQARIQKEEPSSDRFGEFPRPSGTYKKAKAKMEEALRTNAPPSPKLIKINTHLNKWESYLGIGRVSSFPVVLNAAINDVCNARCLFCPYDPKEASPARIKIEDLKNASWLKFVRTFRPNGALAEPLSHPEITDILGLVREMAPYIELSLTTNASLMTPQLIETIAGFVSTMRISLNAARKESYEILMTPLKWEQTIDNLKRLEAAKIRLGTDKPRLIGSYVLNNHNLDELPELPALLSSLGMSTVSVVEMFIPPQFNSRKVFSKDDAVQADKEHIQQVYSKFRNECERYGISLTSPLPYT